MDEEGPVGRMSCLQTTEELKCRRQERFSPRTLHRAQNTVNSGFKRSKFLTLSAIKKWNYFISGIFFF